MIEDFITGYIIVFAAFIAALMLAGEILLWKKVPGWGPRAHLTRMLAPIFVVLIPVSYMGPLGEED